MSILASCMAGSTAALHSWARIDETFTPTTSSAHLTQFRTFIALFFNLPIVISVYNILFFLEYLVRSSISPRVVQNYLIKRFLTTITINSSFAPTHQGIFDIRTIYLISMACDHLSDTLLFKAIFLTAFYAFFRMSNKAPHSKKAFDPTRHTLRQDLIFASPGLHIIVKWTKTLQDRKAHHNFRLPFISNMYLCTVRAIRALLASRPLPPSARLFTVSYFPHHQVIDTHIRDALKQALTYWSIPLSGHGLHTFRRLGATFCFNDIYCRILCPMAHDVAQQYGHTYTQAASTIPHRLLLPFLSLLLPRTLLPFSLGLVRTISKIQCQCSLLKSFLVANM